MGDSVVSAQDFVADGIPADGSSDDASSDGDGYFTIDQLFDDMELAAPTSVQYDPVLGYPVSIQIGTIANDAGLMYYIKDLQPIELK